MELALIPPISLLADTAKTNVQLMLPQLLKIGLENPLDSYSLMYLGYCRSLIHYVIMDNGAAEEQQLRNDELLLLARTYQPDEFAIPDVLADGEATLIRASDFFHNHQGDIDSINNERDVDMQLGFVAQGRSANAAINTVSRMMQYKWSSQIDVIYIPRLLLIETDDPMVRIKIFKSLYARFGPRFDYHFFGSSPRYTKEIFLAADQPQIRSIDTSLPYVMGYKKPNMLRRPDNYFDLPAEDFPYAGNFVYDLIEGIK